MPVHVSQADPVHFLPSPSKQTHLLRSRSHRPCPSGSLHCCGHPGISKLAEVWKLKLLPQQRRSAWKIFIS